MALQSVVALSSITLSAASAAVSFSNIPNTYRDLIIVGNISSGNSGDGVATLRFNGDSATSYQRSYVYGEGTSSQGHYINSGTYINFTLSNINANKDLVVCNIFDYANTNKSKATSVRGSVRGIDVIFAQAAKWASNSPITSIQLAHSGTNTFAAGSTFYLYGRIA